MNGTAPLLAVLVLLVAGVAAPVGAAVADAAGPVDVRSQTGTPTAGANGSAEAPPGAHLAGVVEVGEVEVESDLAGRAFGIRLARADSNESKAQVVAEQVADLRQQVRALAEHKRELIEARENGNISRTEFQVQMTAIGARSGAVDHQLDGTQAAARGLPADLLESKGVNASAIQAIRNDSRALAGPEVAAIARSIGGLGVRDGPAAGNASVGLTISLPGPATDTGPPGPPDRANETEPPAPPTDDGTAGPSEGNGSTTAGPGGGAGTG